MPKYVPKKGHIIEIEFWDHADGDTALQFKTWGRFLKEDEISYTIATWTYSDQRLVAIYEDTDVVRYTILKSTVTGIRKLGVG